MGASPILRTAWAVLISTSLQCLPSRKKFHQSIQRRVIRVSGLRCIRWSLGSSRLSTSSRRQDRKDHMRLKIMPLLTLVGLATMGLASLCYADPITLPTGLTDGDQYRIVFVTTGTTNAYSTDINYYRS